MEEIGLARWRVAVLASMCAAAIGLTGAAAAAENAPGGRMPSRVDVPLTIWDTAGVARSREPVSTGVPLPRGLLNQPAGLAVFDSAGRPVPAQFKVQERWRGAGIGQGDLSIKWLLVTFLADVPKGGKAVYRLRAGSGPPPPQPVTVAEQADAFEMGGLRFKKDFSEPFQLILTDAEGRTIAAGDLPVTWSVWEAGPVRACLKAESPTVPGKFGFIAWIYAYAGLQRWDLTVVLKNTSRETHGPLYFRDVSVIWSPAGLEGVRGYLLGGEWGKAVGGALTGENAAYLYQASDGTDLWDRFGKDWVHAITLDWSKEKTFAKGGVPGFRGYKVLQAGRELGAGNFAQGWAALTAGGQSALACVRHFRQNYPKAVEVQPGRIVVRLWPRYWQGYGGLHWLDDCQRKSHEISFVLAPERLSASRGEALARAFDEPLIAQCPVDWYRGTGVGGFIAKRFTDRQPEVRDKQEPTHHNWVTFGGDITDRIRRRYHGASMAKFVKTGDPTSANWMAVVMRHSAGMTPLWIDDYRFPRDEKVLAPTTYCSPARNTGQYRPGTKHHGYMPWNHQHFVCPELHDSWRLFGDPLALDAIQGTARYIQFYIEYRKTHGIGETRLDALPMTVLCDAYRVTGDESYLRSIRDLWSIMWKTVNKERGYYVPNRNVKPPPGADKPFMLNYLMDGMRDYYNLTGDETAADVMLGITDYCMAEGWISGAQGFVYTIPVDIAEVRKQLAERRAAEKDPNWKPRGWTSVQQMFRSMAWAYLYTGEARYKERIDQLVAGCDRTTYLRYLTQAASHFDWGDVVDRVLEEPRPDTTPPEAITDLRAEALGGGKVRLTWTAPADGGRYQVKWADRPMVERIQFPDQRETHANWWAANNVAGEPAPVTGGSKQSMVVEAVPAGTRYFAVRSFDAASNRSAISNMGIMAAK